LVHLLQSQPAGLVRLSLCQFPRATHLDNAVSHYPQELADTDYPAASASEAAPLPLVLPFGAIMQQSTVSTSDDPWSGSYKVLRAHTCDV